MSTSYHGFMKTLLTNGTVVDVINEKLIKADVLIEKGIIQFVGEATCRPLDTPPEDIKIIDCTNKFLLPSLMDAHVHVESSKLSPAEFARIIIAHGTTAILTDPHEIANVLGMDGVDYIADGLRDTHLNAFVMFPSCVPQVKFDLSGFFGLAEVMDVQGVLRGDKEIMDKIKATKVAGKPIDGHIVGFSREQYKQYFSHGIRTNHEVTTTEEANWTIENGAWVQLRYGSADKSMPDLIPAITNDNWRKFSLCTDDKQANDILAKGHINESIRILVQHGIDPIRAIAMATLNTAECYGMTERGSITEGKVADIVIVDDLQNFNVEKVFIGGKCVLSSSLGTACGTPPQRKRLRSSHKSSVAPSQNSIHIPRLTPDNFKPSGDLAIKMLPNSLLTVADTKNNTSNLIAAIDRYGTSEMTTAWVNGFGFKAGAFAQSISHDDHNIIAIGTSAADMAVAVNQLKNIGGGIVVVRDGEVLAELPLPIAGLMSPESVKVVAGQYDAVRAATHTLGVPKEINVSPMASFMSLPVIPKIKITAKGVVDVKNGKMLVNSLDV